MYNSLHETIHDVHCVRSIVCEFGLAELLHRSRTDAMEVRRSSKSDFCAWSKWPPGTCEMSEMFTNGARRSIVFSRAIRVSP